MVEHLDRALAATRGRIEGPDGAAALLGIYLTPCARACVSWGWSGSGSGAGGGRRAWAPESRTLRHGVSPRDTVDLFPGERGI